jgi:hypothetical protein
MCVVFPPLLLLICMPVAVTVHAAGQHTHIQRLPQVAGAETVLPPPDPGTLVNADLHFSLPPNGIVTKVQATVSFAFPGGRHRIFARNRGKPLAFLSIDGKHFAPIIQKLNSNGGAGSREITTFISYDMPVKYTTGRGILHVEANPFGCWSNWEIQGTIHVGFPQTRN